MRCWLLAFGFVIAPLGMQVFAAEEPIANELRKEQSATTGGGNEAQATLAALSTAVRVPPRRHAAKPAAAESGRPAPIVRLAKPSPYAPIASRDNPTTLDGLATRLVSHSEANSTLTEIPSEEAPETHRSAVRPATAWTPTEVGDVEEESPAPAATPIAVAMKPELQPVPPTIRIERPTVVIEEPAIRAVPSAIVREVPSVTLTVKPSVGVEKRESSRAGGGFSNNPLRQASPSAIINRDLDNPLR